MKKLTLREIQLTELALMIEFDKTARQYGLRYTLCGGTLLGAVRHQGFIPWDDDIDISMPRPDYEKLLRLNRENCLWPSHMKLCSFEDGTLESPYIKIFDTRTKIVEENYTQKDVSSLWIDIFPVDGLPNNPLSIKRHIQHVMRYCQWNISSVVKNGYGSSKLVTLVKDFILKPTARMVGRKQISAHQRNLALKYPYTTSPKCGIVTWPFDGPGQALTIAEYEDLILLPFEGHTFYTVSSWDKMLTGIFGDYMQLPPEEDRITHNLEAFLL